MNEEEKKSIEILKERKRDLLGLSNSSFYSCDRKLYKERVEAIDTILNLIEKQQKEIEKLLNIKLYACDENKNKECDKKYCYINGGECDATTDITKVKYINLDNYIHKDKIRKKLEKIEELYNEKAKEEKFEYTNNQFIVDFIALVEELLEV